MVVLILRQQQNGIFRRELLLDGRVPVKPVEFIVRTHAVVVLVVQVKRVTSVPEGAELRSQFAKLAVAAVFRKRAQADPVSLKQPRVLLLRNVLRKIPATDR